MGRQIRHVILRLKLMIKTELNLILKGKRNQIQKDYKDLRNLLKGEDIESKIVNHIINN